MVDEPCAECGSALPVGVGVSAGPVENRCWGEMEVEITGGGPTWVYIS